MFTLWNDLKHFCPKRFPLCAWARIWVHTHTETQQRISRGAFFDLRDIFTYSLNA